MNLTKLQDIVAEINCIDPRLHVTGPSTYSPQIDITPISGPAITIAEDGIARWTAGHARRSRRMRGSARAIAEWAVEIARA